MENSVQIFAPIVRRHCQSCGGKLVSNKSYFGRPKFGCCGSCWNRFISWVKRGTKRSLTEEKLEIHFNEWVAGKIAMAATQLEKRGVIGRCEAYARNVFHNGVRGTAQCSNYATMIKDGRRICSRHARFSSTTYIDQEENIDPYLLLQAQMVRVARADKRFREIVLQLVSTFPQ